MSSQKGNVARSRPQRHQNTFSFKNDKFDKSVQTKKINAKLHDGVCQRCKEVLEWRVKYSKYKPLSKPKKWILFIHERHRERESERGRDTGRGRSRLHAGSPTWDSIP
ncbi:guanine deaminase isoform 4-T5 [Lycaon pictus]